LISWGVVDVYTLSLDADAARLDQLYEILSPEERERARRFHFAEHRRQSILCRGTLRETLARYLHRNPAAIAFAYNRYGKPYVRGADIRFNLSHSGAWAMLAVTRDREVGVDIERIDPRFAQDQIPEQFFSPREVEQLRSLPQREQTAAFFRCWTCKEAYIKARGLGLSLPLDSFDVSLRPDDPPALLRAGNWSIQNLEAPSGYAAAIVAEGGEFNVSICGASLDRELCSGAEATALLPA
jgi:4'-phosphopantetheinyl transferase